MSESAQGKEQENVRDINASIEQEDQQGTPVIGRHIHGGSRTAATAAAPRRVNRAKRGPASLLRLHLQSLTANRVEFLSELTNFPWEVFELEQVVDVVLASNSDSKLLQSEIDRRISNSNFSTALSAFPSGTDNNFSPNPAQTVTLALGAIQRATDANESKQTSKDLLRAFCIDQEVVTQLPPEILESLLCIFETGEDFEDEELRSTATEAARVVQEQLDKMFTNKMDQSAGTDAETATGGIMSTDTDSSSIVVNILADLGPACTSNAATLRETLNEVSGALSGGVRRLDEVAIARLIVFFADKGTQQRNGTDDMSSALLGALLPSKDSGSADANEWNLNVVSKVLSEDYYHVNWADVARHWDFRDLYIRDIRHLGAIFELYRIAAKREPPLSSIACEWRNPNAQCSLLENLLVAPPNMYSVPLSEAEAADAAILPAEGLGTNPQAWASSELLHRLLFLSDVQALARRIRDLFVKALLNCPEVLLCALVRLQLSFTSSSNDRASNVGIQMKGELMRELIPLFFKPNPHHRVQNGPGALRRLWTISPNTVAAASIEAWRSTAGEKTNSRYATVVHIISIIRLLPSPENAINTVLNGNKDSEFSVAVAFVMADNELLPLQTWLTERASAENPAGALFIFSLVSYLGKTYSSASPRGTSADGKGAPLVSLENLAVSLQVLRGLDSAVLSQPLPAAMAAGFAESGTANLGDSVSALSEACFATHPSVKARLTQPAGSNQGSGANNADDIEEMANSYFQKIYTSEQSIGEVVEMLKRFKASGNSRENDIFACMIHNLFDEYRFFSKYPEKELRITGILFGTLIQQQLVSSITLGIALRYVLEALRKPPSPPGSTNSNSGKMFRFGMFALEQFKGRLHEWPQYCSHIVQIPHLKEGYADLVAEIEGAMAESQNKGSTPSAPAPAPDAMEQPPDSADSSARTTSSGSFGSEGNFQAKSPELQLSAPAIPLPEPRRKFAVFGPGLGRAVNRVDSTEKEHEAPPDAILDKVQFLINNVSPSNVEPKAQELKDMLAAQYFGWLGHYLVVKRISTQPNFHSLYLAFLDQLGDYGKGLVEAILASVYLNVGKLLRSPKITTSTSERSLLKNLGSWLGQITLARNRPILQLMLDCKELLFQGYENGMLIAVTPFVAKILEGSKKSIVFRPPNPWLMGLLSVFRALYGVEDLKMNIKFEIEVLCKNLGVKLDEIPLHTEDLSNRIAPVKERNPDFNMKSSMVNQSSTTQTASAPGPSDNAASAGTGAKLSGFAPPAAGGASASSTPGTDMLRSQFGSPGSLSQSAPASAVQDQQQTVIPNLAAYVTINPSLTQLLQQSQELAANISHASLKRAVPIAVDRAIREIIQPVVERSVTIACMTTKEIVTKDFAMESDENKMRKAAQLMVANLAGSMAHVTCRDPLRASVSTHLRQLLISNATGSATSGSSGAATPQLSEQEQNAIEQCVAMCATDNLELGCMLIEKAATEKAVRDVDEALSSALNARRKHREQTGQPFYDMSIFGNGNQRYPGALPEPLRPKPGGLRGDQLLVYEAFQRMPRQLTVQGSQQVPAAPGVIGSSGSRGTGSDAVASAGVNMEALTAVVGKLESMITSLLTTAGPRASEVTLSMLPADHEVRQLISASKRVCGTADPKGLSSTEKDTLLGFSQGVFKRLYELRLTEPLRLEALVSLLENVNEVCPQLGQDLGTWASYAPTETDFQRKLHRTVLLLLVRSHLVPVTELDSYLSRNIDGGRSLVWVEFALLFVRTALLEKIATPVDFPQVIDNLTKIADGRSQASTQVLQSCRKPIVRMIEELRGSTGALESRDQVVGPTAGAGVAPMYPTHAESSCISSASLNKLSDATRKAAEANELTAKNDPPNAKQQVAFLLDGWIRVQNEPASNEKALVQYLQLLQQHGVGKNEDLSERFFRLATIIVVEAVLKPASGGSGGNSSSTQGKALDYSIIDAYAKLIALLVRYLNDGSSTDNASLLRIALLNKVLGITVRAMMSDYENAKRSSAPVPRWDQRPWFRLLLCLLQELNTPNPTLDPISLGILSVFGSAFHVIQPLVVPGFAFAWLELVSHRMFLSNLLLLEGHKGWEIAHQLLIDLFLFLEPHLRRTELTDAMKQMYKGTLRVLLVILHDFPGFLSGYHLSFCNVIPENCVQLRNLILSAFPRGMPLPDPFTPNLKIDLLPEIGKSPLVLSNVTGPLESMRSDLDGFLKNRQPADFVSSLLPKLYKDGSDDVDAPRVNSLVLYVGMQAIARLQNSQIAHALAHTPEMEVLQKLMDFDQRGRYVCLNAIANQLRYPSSHTHYYSCVMLFLFSEVSDDAVKEQVTRVLLERLIVHRPHPWGLLITFIELIKNQRYQFWSYPFTRCATEIEKVFESVARSCMPPGSQRSATVGGSDESH